MVGILGDDADPMVAVMKVDKAPLETYADIGGLESQIQEIKEAVELPLTHPELYEDIGIRPPKGMIPGYPLMDFFSARASGLGSWAGWGFMQAWEALSVVLSEALSAEAKAEAVPGRVLRRSVDVCAQCCDLWMESSSTPV